MVINTWLANNVKTANESIKSIFWILCAQHWVRHGNDRTHNFKADIELTATSVFRIILKNKFSGKKTHRTNKQKYSSAVQSFPESLPDQADPVFQSSMNFSNRVLARWRQCSRWKDTCRPEFSSGGGSGAHPHTASPWSEWRELAQPGAFGEGRAKVFSGRSLSPRGECDTQSRSHSFATQWSLS